MENHLWTNQLIKISYNAISCCHRKILDKNCTQFPFSRQTSKVSDLQASFSAPPALDKLCTTWIESLLAQTSNSTNFILFSIKTWLWLWNVTVESKEWMSKSDQVGETWLFDHSMWARLCTVSAFYGTRFSLFHKYWFSSSASTSL